MYKQVKDENDQLRDELEGLKKKLETKDVKSLATSWSEVGGEELLPSPPPEDTLGGSFEAYSWWKQGGVGDLHEMRRMQHGSSSISSNTTQ